MKYKCFNLKYGLLIFVAIIFLSDKTRGVATKKESYNFAQDLLTHTLEINEHDSLFSILPVIQEEEPVVAYTAFEVFSNHILDKGQLPPERLLSFLWWHNKKIPLAEIKQLVSLYIAESAIEGVNHDIAFCQMCHETGFLRYNGDVCRTQFNYCGLGAIGNGDSGLVFTSMEEGVRAHIQHLKMYASTDALQNPSVSDRGRFVRRGTVTTISGLTGSWAADPLYAEKINAILNRVYSGDYLTTKPNKQKKEL
ncbi:MAG: glucosaminidase domain-containing protein [Lentimicrobiaceae bacterium]|jgi:hypothetical protein|nr:glucosaminidase domain-containing protein [Lentimicrobiaceae bacterium]